MFGDLAALAQCEPDRALEVAATFALTREQRAFYSSLFDRLARENIVTTLPRLAAVPPGEARANALRALTDVWVRTDFAAALAWAQTLPAADRPIALETVLLDLAPRDPSQAIELAQKNLNNSCLDRVVLSALQTLAPSILRARRASSPWSRLANCKPKLRCPSPAPSPRSLRPTPSPGLRRSRRTKLKPFEQP